VATRGALQNERKHAEQRKQGNADESAISSHAVTGRACNRKATPLGRRQMPSLSGVNSVRAPLRNLSPLLNAQLSHCGSPLTPFDARLTLLR
jgi:hypothetical protein